MGTGPIFELAQRLELFEHDSRVKAKTIKLMQVVALPPCRHTISRHRTISQPSQWLPGIALPSCRRTISQPSQCLPHSQRTQQHSDTERQCTHTIQPHITQQQSARTVSRTLSETRAPIAVFRAQSIALRKSVTSTARRASSPLFYFKVLRQSLHLCSTS